MVKDATKHREEKQIVPEAQGFYLVWCTDLIKPIVIGRTWGMNPDFAATVVDQFEAFSRPGDDTFIVRADEESEAINIARCYAQGRGNIGPEKYTLHGVPVTAITRRERGAA